MVGVGNNGCVPKVSILLTCYNHIAYLEDAIRSIESQTITDYEVIVLDDGSTDGTRERLQERVPSWRLVFHEQNLGTYGSLNRGLELATGEFVAIFNDDDVWEPRKLEAQLELFENFPRVGIVHTNGIFIGSKGEQLAGTPLGFDYPETETGSLVLRLLRSNAMIASSVMVRKKCFDELGMFDPAYFGSGDWDMWLRIAEKWEGGYCVEKLTRYRWHDENASKKLDRIWHDDERLRERVVAQTAFYESLGLPSAELREALAHNFACLGTVRKLNGKAALARQAYASSIRLCPQRVKSYLRWIATFLPRDAFLKLK